MAKNLTVYRGDDKTINLTFKDGSAVAIDITDWTVFFTVKEDRAVPDAQADLQKVVTVHTDPDAGLSAITLDATDTDDLSGNYFYDIQVRTDEGKIMTVLSGIITF